MENNSDIKIRLDSGEWKEAFPYQKNAYSEYKMNSSIIERPYIYDNGGFKFSIQRENNNPHNPTYLVRGNGLKSPIIDWNDIKVFIINNTIMNWQNAYSYQKWAYIHYVYSGDIIGNYKSNDIIDHLDYHIIPNQFSNNNIIFNILRNEHGSIYYKKINTSVCVRISDSHIARMAYLGYYNRITSDIGMIIEPPTTHLNLFLPLPTGIILEYTTDDNKMCIICNEIKQNIRFEPCLHNHTCSKCYLCLTKPRECPYCKQYIEKIELI